MAKKISLEEMYKGIAEEQVKKGIDETICIGLAQVCEMLAEEYKEVNEKLPKIETEKEKCPCCGRIIKTKRKKVLKNKLPEHFLRHAKIFRALAEIHKSEIKKNKLEEVKKWKKN